MKMRDFDITMTQYNKGDIVTGTIVMIGKDEVVVAIGGLKECVFPRSELEPTFKVGDAILVMLTGKVDEKGCLVVTHADINKILDDKEKLKNLKVGSELSFKVDDVIGAGLVGSFMGYRVFLPYSQCCTKDFVNKDNLKSREITAIVIELNNLKKSIVCSTKLLESNQIKPIAVGDVINGTVTKLEDKYAIVLLTNGAKAKLSISDASHDHISSLKDVVELDHEYVFKVLETNTDFSRISVGLKQLIVNPKDILFDSLKVGDIVTGTVEKILAVGAVIKLENGLNAMAITKENSDRANVATHHLYKLGSVVTGIISRMDKNGYKINLQTSLKSIQD